MILLLDFRIFEKLPDILKSGKFGEGGIIQGLKTHGKSGEIPLSHGAFQNPAYLTMTAVLEDLFKQSFHFFLTAFQDLDEFSINIQQNTGDAVCLIIVTAVDQQLFQPPFRKGLYRIAYIYQVIH